MYYVFVCFVFNDTPTTEIYTSRHTLSLHDALPSALQGRSIPHHCSRDHQQQGRDEDGGSLVPAGRPTPSGRAGATARLRSIVSSMAAQLCVRSEEHTSDLQSLMRISYDVFCLTKKITQIKIPAASTSNTTKM